MFRRPPLKITQAELLALAEKHEPAASASPAHFRMATCVACGRRMIRMYHCWLVTGGFKKELHLCRRKACSGRFRSSRWSFTGRLS